MTRVSVDPRAPCIVGVAQRTIRPREGPAPEPLESWVDMASAAAADAGVPDVLGQLDSVQVVYCQSWQYDEPVARLCERIGANPRHSLYSGIGGTKPPPLGNDVPGGRRRGELETPPLFGSEPLSTKRWREETARKTA